MPRSYNGERSVLNKWGWDNCIAACKRVKLYPYLISYKKITLNGLNVRAKTTKLLEENLGVHLYDFRFGNRLLDMTLKARTTKEK